ncbi:prolyl oligopeptidase family protein [Streptomyces sp. ISL-94]|uniref:prolyl oligopeptidase family serine peptidase n=1 Tax=Streptomyces sp. ISL-94 TaxID=2819190 RepID=UPI001BE99D66|nr:prolyl oligopeptidase family serine peptidase [Streptomyces sp. ISL-94]MBT2478762.1 S9 family peptidase [Streptomyces sp. ISL-94]
MPAGTQSKNRLIYPAARRRQLVEVIHGRTVSDPYRWLEQPDDDETRQWMRAQDELSHTVLDDLPGREWLRTQLSGLVSVGVTGPPVWRGARKFFMKRRAGQEHAVLHIADPDGTEQVLLDPMTLDPTGRTTLDSWQADAEGRRLAYQISVGGDRDSRLYVLDIDTGTLLDGPITGCRQSPVAWLPEGEKFYYVRSSLAGSPSRENRYHRRVYLHTIGTDPDTCDQVVFGEDGPMTAAYHIAVGPGGRWLTVTRTTGAVRRNEIWIAELTEDNLARPAFVPLYQGQEAHTNAVVGKDGRVYMHTDLDAPRGRLAVVGIEDLQSGEWTELLPQDHQARLEHFAVLDGAGLERGVLLAGWSRHSISEITVHDLETGDRLGAIPLPGLGAVGEIRGRGHEAWFTYTDPFTPITVYRWDALTRTTSVWAVPPSQDTDDGAHPHAQHPVGTMQQITCVSPDGTEVRVTVLAPQGRTGPLPTILYGYGGFGLSPAPVYNPEALAWVQAGGVYAIAHVRGGLEEGTQWHVAGTRANKQRSIDDFHAAARALVSGRWTAHSQLVISGESNGGMLVGAALTQQPHTYRAALCTAPLLDMVRYEHSGLGPSWTAEYGSASVPEELGWLLGYSPYHRVTAEADYPAVLFTVSDGDTLVDPLHARKMCAALQHAAGGKAQPVGRGLTLLRREAGVGHGARAVSRIVELSVDQLSFAAQQTGLQLPRT